MFQILKFEGKDIQIFHGETVGAALRRNNFPIPFGCGGKNRCGNCRIRLLEGDFICGEKILTGSSDAPPEANSCTLRMLSSRGTAARPAEKTSGLKMPENMISARSGDTMLAIDLGSTNIAAAVICDGKVINSAERLNHQTFHGDNVIDRIAFAAQPGGADTLRKALVSDTIVPLIDSLLTETESISKVVAAGNTVMTHFFFKEDPSPLGKTPFEPLKKHFSDIAGNLGLTNLKPQTPIFGLPHICSFIGGDVSAGLEISGFGSPANIELFIDSGTNCEMILNSGGRFYALSAAAGPAFERSHSRAGGPDILKHIRFENGKWEYFPETCSPQGLCGSALIDLLAELHRNHFIDDFGKWQNSPALPETLMLSNSQLAELVTAKAAIASGLDLLLKYAGITQKEIRKVYLSGNFSLHTDLVNAKYLNLLPELSDDRFIKTGNTALTGAAAAALDPELACRMEQWQHKIIHINPAEEPDYMKYFVSRMCLTRGEKTS